MADSSETAPLSARVAQTATLLCLLICGGGLLGAQTGNLSAFLGFRVFAGGSLLGAVALIFGVAGIFNSGGRPGRKRSLFAIVVGGALLGVLGAFALPASELPLINDISTDLEDPPAFVVLAQVPANTGRDMAYPEPFVEAQRAGYPTLGPLVLPVSADSAWARARRAANALGWEVRLADPVGRSLEATATSAVFGFVDDVVVRVQAVGDSARVDMRSKSRDGTGDLGANAARIRRFQAQLR